MTQQEKTSKASANSPKPLSTTSPAPEPKQEAPRYQWSIFLDPAKREQFVVRCDDLGDLLTDREVLLGLIAQEKPPEPAQPPPPEEDPTHCLIHNVPMKERKSKNGNTWFDHRWQDENDVWHLCNGKTIKTQ